LAAAALLVAANGPTETLAQQTVTALAVQPESLELDAPEVTEQLLVSGLMGDGGTVDLTRDATYLCTPPDIVQVSSNGRVTPVRDGSVEIRVVHGTISTTVRANVQGQAVPPQVFGTT
jgi:hypothetical protein